MNHSIYINKKVVYDLESLCDGVTPSSKGEYCVECPECYKEFGESKYKLYIKSDFSVGFCQRCKCTFINKQKSPDKIDIDNLKTPSFIGRWESKTYELDRIDVSYYEYSKDYLLDEVNYLIKRNPSLDPLYKDLKFKFRKNKIVIPFYWNNEVFYYQIRSTLNRDEAPLPYFCPPIDNKPIWINPMNIGTSELIITEGVFGAIGAWLSFKKKFDVISIQGSYITKYQLWMLSNLSYSKFHIYCDTWDISLQIIKTLKSSNPLLYENCDIIKSKFGDPEDDYINKSVIH